MSCFKLLEIISHLSGFLLQWDFDDSEYAEMSLANSS